MQRLLQLLTLLGVACTLITLSGLTLNGSPVTGRNSHYVFAHWIVPIDYEPRQSSAERNKDDVRAAIEEGLDGFALDAFSGPQAKGEIEAFIAAADKIGAANFKVFLSADMSTNFTAAGIVNTIVTYGNNSHYLKMDGRPVLSTYRGDKRGNTWWLDNVINPLTTAGHPVTFLPFFDRPSPNGDTPNYNNWAKTLRSLPVVNGLFNFGIPASPPFYTGDPNLGHHMWSGLEGEENLAKALHDAGKLFIARYAPYFWAVCHPARQYIEHQAGRGMENAWTSIITKQKPEAVEIVTWNDYTESTFIQPTRIPPTKTAGIPSYSHIGYYELLKYYISWYHVGTRPHILKDAVFYFYRPNSRGTVSSGVDAFCPLGRVKSTQIWGNPQNVIYITTALTSSAELRVSTGGKARRFSLPAGLITTDVPFAIGPQIIELWRDGKRLTSSQGPDIREDLLGDNFNVYSGYSVASGSNSETWRPTDAWKTGFIADWFKE